LRIWKTFGGYKRLLEDMEGLFEDMEDLLVDMEDIEDF
jgi:hypothetical protein